MTAPRHDVQSGGPWVSGFSDPTDLKTGAAYDYTRATNTNIPALYAAQYGWILDPTTGIPRLLQKPGSMGPISGLLQVPGGGSNGNMAPQHGFLFPAQIFEVDTGPPVAIFAGIIHDAAGGSPNFDAALGGLQVITLDGTTPALNALGIVFLPSDISGLSTPIFFQGGGGGSSRIPAVVTGNASGPGNYTWAEVTPSTNATIMGGRTGNAWERNRSPNVRTDGTAFVDVDTWPSGDQTFFYPLAMCTPP